MKARNTPILRKGYIEDGIGYIPLSQGQIAIVDADMVEELSQYNWHALFAPGTNSFYARRMDYSDGRKRAIPMHRVILRLFDKALHVDHISHDTLDNRRCNLRSRTVAENCRNQRLAKNNKTGFKGVHFHKSSGKFIASVRVNWKLIRLGTHDTPEAAYEAYKTYVEGNFGQFAFADKARND